MLFFPCTKVILHLSSMRGIYSDLGCYEDTPNFSLP